VEALYDPPQLGDMSGHAELPDPKRHVVDMIAAALGLERVGQMFTKLDQETILSETEIRKAAAMQHLYEFDHPVGFKVSKQVTIVVKKNGFGETEFEAYMVSDMA